ncbi:MAG: glycosyltransferase [Candidatus Loosdrechtia sp.]|uniref:glycosyltransferase n=1 Tax=Candidatus Loosdrechtia sp. TaxID=3101272 RepID=UPI003A6A8F47|nr:MAG: glycosyltransferase [Candidatus Jettenia sp. AMX2]
MKILFVDSKSSTPYDSMIMREEGIGGTEGSLVRVARGLAYHHEIAIAQYGRRQAVWVDGVHYLPRDMAPFGTDIPDCTIVLRKHKLVCDFRRRFPATSLYCWIHNWQPAEVIIKRAWLARAGAGLICVSQSHCAHSNRMINGPVARLLGAAALISRRVPVHYIYNPVDDDLIPDGTAVDRDQMIFFSTANKGLLQVLRNFTAVSHAVPTIKLLVAGTRPEDMQSNHPDCVMILQQPGVRLLGRLPQQEILMHLRRSLCVFYPQSMHPETFGLIFAEANAVGVPVLAHDFGAAREVLCSEDQLVDANDTNAVVDRIVSWHRGGRPKVAVRPEFRTSTVIAHWRRLLER